eukprot:GGOE01034383.1.p5 GENE.GGOE01034383.1~~GGOE01034383.1.p5  ORF type:complete len:109 (-),score=10.65 GGOE01034383.1:200-526(-)
MLAGSCKVLPWQSPQRMVQVSHPPSVPDASVKTTGRVHKLAKFIPSRSTLRGLPRPAFLLPCLSPRASSSPFCSDQVGGIQSPHFPPLSPTRCGSSSSKRHTIGFMLQ